MKYFDKYVSNTYAASAHHSYFNLDEGEVRTGRVFYKITVGGEFNYSLLFSNVMDGTLADGSYSYKNLVCDEWYIHSARIGKCKSLPDDNAVISKTMAEVGGDIYVSDFVDITFDGKNEKKVNPGEMFYCDEVKLGFEKGEFLCLEMTFSGTMLPYHYDSTLPIFIKENDSWRYDKNMPLPCMIGCERHVKSRIAYVGDSITQGVGMEVNSYLHWNALISEKLGEENAYWNLGLGFGRANDFASNGSWYYKAIQNDVIVVCFGVNDIYRMLCEEQLELDLTKIVTDLKTLGKTVILQTVPPFNLEGEALEIWNNVNSYIKSNLADKVDFLFDCVPVLGEKENPQIIREDMHPKGDLHPGVKGCAAWAEELYAVAKDVILKR